MLTVWISAARATKCQRMRTRTNAIHDYNADCVSISHLCQQLSDAVHETDAIHIYKADCGTRNPESVVTKILAA